MSNQDRAAQCIKASYETGLDTPRDIAEYLAQAGLLAPDLPEPSSIIEEDGEKRICWSAPGCGVELVPGEMIVTYEYQSGHDIEHAHQIALALLAAANHVEENQ